MDFSPTLIGKILKLLRKQRGLSQKVLGKSVSLSASTISRIERGIKILNNNQLLQFLENGGFNTDQFNAVLHSANQISNFGNSVEKDKKTSTRTKRLSKTRILTILKNYFQSQPVKKVYMFGSVARNEHSAESDIDLYLCYAENYPVTIFDLGKMRTEIHSLTGKDVDLVLEGSEYDFVKENLNKEKILIYG